MHGGHDDGTCPGRTESGAQTDVQGPMTAPCAKNESWAPAGNCGSREGRTPIASLQQMERFREARTVFPLQPSPTRKHDAVRTVGTSLCNTVTSTKMKCFVSPAPAHQHQEGAATLDSASMRMCHRKEGERLPAAQSRPAPSQSVSSARRMHP